MKMRSHLSLPRNDERTKVAHSACGEWEPLDLQAIAVYRGYWYSHANRALLPYRHLNSALLLLTPRWPTSWRADRMKRDREHWSHRPKLELFTKSFAREIKSAEFSFEGMCLISTFRPLNRHERNVLLISQSLLLANGRYRFS
uniref:Uncharacterized protein n=1 Tax=Trichuris muris TaxID=70415 RepID=A0A5S6QG53_TRIMR